MANNVKYFVAKYGGAGKLAALDEGVERHGGHERHERVQGGIEYNLNGGHNFCFSLRGGAYVGAIAHPVTPTL